MHAVKDDLDTNRYIPPVLQEWGDSEVCCIYFHIGFSFIFSNCISIKELWHTELCIFRLVLISVIPMFTKCHL